MKHWTARAPLYAAWIACTVSIVLALPAFCVWLGLPPEGDAVDYRVPLVRWIATHGSIPNWPWTYIDDYPLLGDLAMALCFRISPYLMRAVPLSGYILCAYFAGKIYLSLGLSPRNRNPLSAKTAFFTAAAWALGFRLLALQANLLMLDTLASGLTLGCFYYFIARRSRASGALAALALATRYTTWLNVALVGAFQLLRWAQQRKSERRRTLYGEFVFFPLACLGALPWMIRNWHLNHNPIFPLAAHLFNGFQPITVFSAGYGRGTSPLHLLLLPFDIVYTNTFVRGMFDYTIGKLFYVQMITVALCLSLAPKRFREAAAELRNSPGFYYVVAFIALQTIAWFYSAQQLRFLAPGLFLLNLGMLYICERVLPAVLLSVLTVLCVFSVVSIEKDSILMALGKRPSIFQAEVDRARACFARAGVQENALVGHFFRDGVIGFFANPFVFVGSHPYLLPENASQSPTPEFIYDPDGSAKPPLAFERWPNEKPCVWKRRESASPRG